MNSNDSLEGNIWDYQPVVKKRIINVSTSESESQKKQVSRKKSVSRPRSILHKKACSSTTAPIASIKSAFNKTESIKNSCTEQAQVIDVDLEPDYNLPEQLAGCSESERSKSQGEIFGKRDLNEFHIFTSSRGSVPTANALQSAKQTPKPKAKCSPVKKKPRRQSGNDANNGSLKTYFSPTKTKPNVQNILSSSDTEEEDDLILLDPLVDTVRVTQEKADVIGKRKPKEGPNLSEVQSVDVDVILDEEIAACSFKTNNIMSSGESSAKENVCCLSAASSSATDEHNSQGVDFELLKTPISSEAPNIVNSDKTVSASQETMGVQCSTQGSSLNESQAKESQVGWPSSHEYIEVGQQNSCGGFLLESEDLSNKYENESLDNTPDQKRSCNNKYIESLVKIESSETGVSIKNGEETAGGGFIIKNTKLERDTWTQLHPYDNRCTLSSSMSCPPTVPASVKQTDLFSFFKVKPGPGGVSTMSKKSTHQGLTRSNSASSDLFHHGSRAKNISGAGPLCSGGASGASEDSFQTNGRKKQCPFYKKIPGTAITVDAFRYGVIPGCEAYVLTHFHYDHYGGLTKKFSQPLFCSQVTGNLVEGRIGVEKRYINRLPMWKPCKVAGVTVTLMEANHCPGAVIILFELKDGRKILHTGDFRASKEMETYGALQGVRISELYLDTTYCNPSYAFPDQTKVVESVVNLVLNHISNNPSTLVICGAYTIGKERIFAAIAKALDSKICVMNDKKKVLDCLEDPDLKSRVTLDWSKGRVHVLPMGKLNQQSLKEHLARHSKFNSILAIKPTGWTHSDQKSSLHNLTPTWSRDGIMLYGVPYSEHSSFLELKRFVQHFRPLKILPTVNNGSPAARAKMDAIFKEWMQEKPINQ